MICHANDLYAWVSIQESFAQVAVAAVYLTSTSPSPILTSLVIGAAGSLSSFKLDFVFIINIICLFCHRAHLCLVFISCLSFLIWFWCVVWDKNVFFSSLSSKEYRYRLGERPHKVLFWNYFSCSQQNICTCKTDGLKKYIVYSSTEVFPSRGSLKSLQTHP